MIHASSNGYEFRPDRSSGIHCTQCGIVFAEPAPPLDVNGERICNYCHEKAARDAEILEAYRRKSQLF